MTVFLFIAHARNDTGAVHNSKKLLCDSHNANNHGSVNPHKDIEISGSSTSHNVKENRTVHTSSIAGKHKETEPNVNYECPPTSLPDIRSLEVCGSWIRTCHRECLCNKRESIVSIPKIVHFIKDGNLTFSDWLAIVAAKKYIKPFEINLYSHENTLPNCWMRRLRLIDRVRVINLSDKQWLESLNNVTVCHVEHQSDLLRNAILYHYGGIYMDTDAIATKSFDSLLNNHSVVLGRNMVNRIGNGLIISRQQSCLICDYATEACDSFDGSWTKHSTVSLSNIVDLNGTLYNDLLVLNYTSGFFPFSWKKIHFNELFDVESSEVDFSPTQVYALHLFGSKFPEKISERFQDLNWLNGSHSILATHLRTLINSQVLISHYLNETLCEDLPTNFLS